MITKINEFKKSKITESNDSNYSTEDLKDLRADNPDWDNYDEDEKALAYRDMLKKKRRDSEKPEQDNIKKMADINHPNYNDYDEDERALAERDLAKAEGRKERELREKIANEIKEDLKYAMENCTALGRDAYGDYIDKMIQMIQNKIINKK
jgi:hypothetical protein